MNGTLGPYVLQLLGSEEGEGLPLKTDDSRGHTEPQHTGITDGRDEVLPTHLPAVLRPPALRGVFLDMGGLYTDWDQARWDTEVGHMAALGMDTIVVGSVVREANGTAPQQPGTRYAFYPARAVSGAYLWAVESFRRRLVYFMRTIS